MYKVDKLVRELQAMRKPSVEWDSATKSLRDVEVAPTVFVHGDTIKVSAEDGNGWANYYGPKGYAEIDSRLETWATQHKMYWEWQDAGCICLYPV